MHILRYFLPLFFIASVQLNAQQSLKGEIDGAVYLVEVPENPSGRVLMLAHGFRPPELPLSADIGSSNDLFDDLIADGWTIASTSYRRNGWIYEDAGKDLINLRKFVEKEVMAPKGVYLFGNSMGGGIIAWLAEHAPEGFDGGLAMGAYLNGKIGDPKLSSKLNEALSGQPKFPILFQTNTSELTSPEAYIELSQEATPAPVLRKIQRAGHVNQNKAEQAAGLDTLVAWVEKGEIDASEDGTIVAAPKSTANLTDGRAQGIVETHVPVYGNFITNFVASDLETLDIHIGDQFHLRKGNRTISAKMGTTYSDVPVGEWVAFFDAEGYLLFCRNYRNAVESLETTEGDLVEIWR